MDELCGGCFPGPPCSACVGALGRVGIRKVHWEAWSNCNLPCSFCYRMRGAPLDTESGLKLIRIIKTGGASSIVFAGGDPSLRDDLKTLTSFASKLGLGVEIQTNAHFQPPHVLDALSDADLVGVSLDAHSAERHDTFRGKQGNFEKVIMLLDFLSAHSIPVIVRSVVAAGTHESIPQIAPLLLKYDNLVRWSLLEFTPIADGYRNRNAYHLPHSAYEETVRRARDAVSGRVEVDAYAGEKKVGTYALITPGGLFYGTGESIDGDYPKIGSVLSEHLCDLVRQLSFSKEKHMRRYGSLPPHS